MSYQAFSWVCEHSPTQYGHRLVLMSLANHADRLGENAFPSVATIAHEAKVSARHVQKILRILEAENHIVSTGVSRSGTTIYSVVGVARDATPVESPPLASTPGGRVASVAQGGGTQATQTVKEQQSNEQSFLGGTSDEVDEIASVLNEARPYKQSRLVKREGVIEVIKDYPGLEHLAVAKDVRTYSRDKQIKNVLSTYRTFCKRQDGSRPAVDEKRARNERRRAAMERVMNGDSR